MTAEHARRRRDCGLVLAVLLGWLFVGDSNAAGQTDAQASPLSRAFSELVGLVRAGQWGTAEWARGSYLALQINRYGQSGVPFMRGRFARAAFPEEAFLSGVYVATHGEVIDQRVMRQTLEKDARKQAWLRAMVGDWTAIRASIKSCSQWQPALRLLPALTGCRAFCRLCTLSEDVLVRRAGMLWGFCMPDAAYWKNVRTLSTSDPDPFSRRFAQYLASRSPTASR